MAKFRKTTKYGSRTVTQGRGGYGGTTTSYSSGSTMKNGRGTRRTVTTKSNGQKYIRITEGSGDGYYRTTQKSLTPTKPRGLKKSSSKDPFKVTAKDWDSLSSGGGSLIGDIFSLVSDIIDVFKNKDEAQPIAESESIITPTTKEAVKYNYRLQYTTDDKQWFYCQSEHDSSDSLQKAKERLHFKQYGTTVNKYRIVKIDDSGYAEPI